MGRAAPVAGAALAAAGWACAPTPSGADATGLAGDSGGAPWTWSGELALTDAEQFSQSTSLALPVAEVAEEADVVLSWGGLQTDMLGQPFDVAAEVDRVVLAHFATLLPEALAAALARDELPQVDLDLYGLCEAEAATSCALSEFALGGNDIEAESHLVEADEGTWLVSLATVTEEATRYRTMLVLEPRAEATATTAELAEGACDFAVDAELDAAAPLRLPLGEVPPVSWAGLTVDGRGEPLETTRIDRLRVARFDESTAELEADFRSLEGLAEESWRWDVEGRLEVDLAEAHLDGSAAPFDGVDAEGTWLLTLECSSCTSPMPLFLGRLQGR